MDVIVKGPVNLLLFGCLLTGFAMTTANAQNASENPWYTVSQVGLHWVNTVVEEPLDATLARYYFAGDFLQKWPLPADANKRRAAALDRLKREQPQLYSGSDPRPFAAVERFSRSRAIVRVYLILGAYRWHHYYFQLARYNIAREPAIDAGLFLPELERKLAQRYRGLGHGSKATDLIALLGMPDQERQGQTLSLRNLYYVKDDLHVEIHHGSVYYLEHGKLGWFLPPPLPGAGPAHGPATQPRKP